MKTYSQKSSEISRDWYLIDASTLPLGKLAVIIADKLMGKSKVTYTPHTDNGDYVVVINAKNVKVTGNKLTAKKYYRHSGFPGGLTELKLEEVLEKLDYKMTTAFNSVYEMSVEKKAYMRDAAYMVSIKRVADAMRLRGWIK